MLQNIPLNDEVMSVTKEPIIMNMTEGTEGYMCLDGFVDYLIEIILQ